MPVIQVGCRLARFQLLLQWFHSLPTGTVFSAADACNQHLLTSICAYFVNNWNSWSKEEARNICRLGDMIVSVYDQPLAVIDLTQDSDSEVPNEIPEKMPEEAEQQECLVVDELRDEDLQEPEEEVENEGDDMLFAFDHLMGNQETESEFNSESESDYDDSDFLTSES
jgi:hypothetical protein